MNLKIFLILFYQEARGDNSSISKIKPPHIFSKTAKAVLFFVIYVAKRAFYTIFI
jgi:hypothetical protein